VTPFITSVAAGADTGSGGNTGGGTGGNAVFNVGGGHDTLIRACGNSPGIACRLVWDASHNGTAAGLVGSFLAHPLTRALQIAFVVLLALTARWVTHRFIDRVTGRSGIGAGRDTARWDPRSLLPKRLRSRLPKRWKVKAAAVLDGGPVLFSERRRQRSHALGSILRSITSAAIFSIAGLTILGDLGINLAPLLASAGVAGVAIGFGAQTIVKDFISGIFMLLEDQYGVGDFIDTGQASGLVESVGLRTTRVRDISGVVWHVRNGTIERIGNKSQGWARAVVDVPLGYDQDLARARKIMTDAAAAMWEEPMWRNVILEAPEVWGVQALWSNLQVLRLVAKTTSLSQWEATRELRGRVTAALTGQGVAVGVHDGSANPIGPDGSSASGPDGKSTYS
jgi:moderate conductance mechanosensitive channel